MKLINILRTVVFSLLILASAGATPAAGRAKELLILHTNDTHSCIVPFPKDYADTAWADKAGAVRRATYFRDVREHVDKDALIFDSGDFSQGSPYYNMFKGDVEIGLMNEMHYDAATIGNHEFDFGLENMARIFKAADFPIVCANYHFEGTPVEGLVKPYIVLKRKGVKIGVFGVGPELDGLVQKKSCKGVRFEDPVAAADRIVPILRHQEHCDVVICLSHLGWSNDRYGDIYFMAHTQGIDLVLGAHSHTFFEKARYVKNKAGKEIPNDQNGKNARYIGVIKMKLGKCSK